MQPAEMKLILWEFLESNLPSRQRALSPMGGNIWSIGTDTSRNELNYVLLSDLKLTELEILKKRINKSINTSNSKL